MVFHMYILNELEVRTSVHTVLEMLEYIFNKSIIKLFDITYESW